MKETISNPGYVPDEDDGIEAFASEQADAPRAHFEEPALAPVSPSPHTVARASIRDASSFGWRKFARPIALAGAFIGGVAFAVLLQQRSSVEESPPSEESSLSPPVARDLAPLPAPFPAPFPEPTTTTSPPTKPLEVVAPPPTVDDPDLRLKSESARPAQTRATVTSSTPPAPRVQNPVSTSAPRALPRPAASVPIAIPPQSKETTTPPIDAPSPASTVTLNVVEPAGATPSVAVSSPPPVAPAPRPDAVARPSAIELDTTAIQGTLGRYRRAFNTLDAGAAMEVWPSVNQRALSRAFERLEEQEMTFGRCRIDVKDARAEATCDGTLRYVPRIGSRTPHVDRTQWKFNLRKNGDTWLIEGVDAR